VKERKTLCFFKEDLSKELASEVPMFLKETEPESLLFDFCLL